MFEQVQTEIQAHLERIGKMRATLDETQARVAETVAQATRLDNLKRERARAIAEAHLDGEKPNTAALDKEIKALDKQVNDNAETYFIDLQSAELLAGRLAAADTKLAELRQQARDTAKQELQAGQNAAVEKYHDAIANLKTIIEEIHGFAIAAEKICGYQETHVFNAHVKGIISACLITEHTHHIGIIPQYSPVKWCIAGGPRCEPGTPRLGHEHGAEMAARYAVP